MKIGLALSGGAAFGYAHLAVLKAFDQLGVKPHSLTGTSMGAIAAATYASGLSADDLLDHADQAFSVRSALFERGPKLLPAQIRQSWSEQSWLGLHAEQVLTHFLPPLPETMEELAIDTTLVATNFTTGQAAAFSEGNLTKALAASIAIPGIFRPVEIEDAVYLDGGLTSPLPTEYLAEDCDFVIAVKVMGTQGINKTRGKDITLADTMIGSIQVISNGLMDRSFQIRKPDLLLSADLSGFKPGDFRRAREIVEANLDLMNQCTTTLSHHLEES